MLALGTAQRTMASLALLSALSIGSWRLFAEERAGLVHHPTSATFPVLVAGIAAVLVQACLAWLVLLTTLVLLEPWSGRDLTSYAGCPPALRRVLLGVCGAAATAGVLATPVAAPAAGILSEPPGQTQPPGHDRRVRAAVLDGLPLPERTLGRTPGRAPGRSPERAPGRAPGKAPGKAPPTAGRYVVVRAGDSLWSIAAAALPTDSAAVAVDHAWREIYAANRFVIGPDPSLIHPGARLHVPTPTPTPTPKETR